MCNQLAVPVWIFFQGNFFNSEICDSLTCFFFFKVDISGIYAEITGKMKTDPLIHSYADCGQQFTLLTINGEITMKRNIFRCTAPALLRPLQCIHSAWAVVNLQRCWVCLVPSFLGFTGMYPSESQCCSGFPGWSWWCTETAADCWNWDVCVWKYQGSKNC